MQWEVVIGLETHAQLTTASKIFSGSSTAFGAEPNSQANVLDLALPGTLPVLNRGAVQRAIQFGLAIGATIAPRSIFARKNYFYPDLPKGYQISQYERPVVEDGALEIVLEDGTLLRWPYAELRQAQGFSAGEEVRLKFFCMRSKYSGKHFVRFYPCERQQAFFDGHAPAYMQNVFTTHPDLALEFVIEQMGLAFSTDLLNWMAQDIVRPEVVVDVNGLAALNGIRYETGTGLTIGAAAPRLIHCSITAGSMPMARTDAPRVSPSLFIRAAFRRTRVL